MVQQHEFKDKPYKKEFKWKKPALKKHGMKKDEIARAEIQHTEEMVKI